MKQKINLIILCSLLFSAPSTLAGLINIDHDESDCVDGWISMDVRVTVDSESFDFNPSCNFSFDDDFVTSEGTECEISAGMCSSFFPLNKFEVSCEGHITESVDIECPES